MNHLRRLWVNRVLPLPRGWYIHYLMGRWWLHRDVLHSKPLFKPWRPWG